MNILLTAGATREPIDDVRFISNVSSGATGAALADALSAQAHRVTVLRARSAVRSSAAAEQREFSSTASLDEALRAALQTGSFDAVIMAAAVSDYRVAERSAGKLSSTPERLTLELLRNPKLLPRLKTYSPRPVIVIGFKLTAGASPDQRRAAVRAQFAAGGVDATVHNDLTDIAAAAPDDHPFNLYASPDTEPARLVGVAALAEALGRVIASRAHG